MTRTSVRDYYESNTSKFLLFGAEGAIHRELWAPGVTTKAEAVHHVHALVLREIDAVSPDGRARVLDLGCGVGAADRFLVAHRPARVYGLSISPRQVTLARGWRSRGQAAGECSFHEADFCALPPGLASELRPIDLAFAIEAFVHAPSADAFFREVANVLRPGGRLVLVDDFLTGPHDGPLIADVRAGWHMQSLLQVSRVASLAQAHGLTMLEAYDLSPFQRLGRPRDKLVHALRPLLRGASRFSPWAESLVGGDALQTCHRRGEISYQLIRFEKS